MRIPVLRNLILWWGEELDSKKIKHICQMVINATEENIAGKGCDRERAYV